MWKVLRGSIGAEDSAQTLITPGTRACELAKVRLVWCFYMHMILSKVSVAVSVIHNFS